MAPRMETIGLWLAYSLTKILRAEETTAAGDSATTVSPGKLSDAGSGGADRQQLIVIASHVVVMAQSEGDKRLLLPVVSV